MMMNTSIPATRAPSPPPAKAAAAARPRSVLLQRIVAEAQRRLHKNAVGLMNENINPLFNMDERRAQMVFDFARSGNYAWLQYLYNEIEERDPTLLVCVTRRTSAVAELNWRVVRSDQRLNRKADDALVQEQIECVETAMAKIDNFPDAQEHLALSAFRGYSMIAPTHDAKGDIVHCDLIDSWNLCYDKRGQSWYFNPSGSAFTMPSVLGKRFFQKDLQYIPPEQVCVVQRQRPIDWPALMIYLRCAVGERDWGRFVETYGLPPVILTMPQFANKEEEDTYAAAAEAIFEGRTGAVPNGTEVSWASESRGTNPFTEFIEHQMKLVVLMSTGGTLASLAESGSGTLAGDAQQDEWLRIIRADKRIISNAINKQICERIIRGCRDFKGKPMLAEFRLDSAPKPTARELAELASSFSSAGFEMDAEELSRLSGFKITKKQEGGMGFNSAPLPPPTTSVAVPDLRSDAREAPLPAPKAEDNAISPSRSAYNASSSERNINIPLAKETPYNANLAGVPAEAVKVVEKPVPPKGNPMKDLAASLQEDFRPIADRLNAILALPESERAAAAVKLLAEVDRLVPDDPAMAEVIAEQMGYAFENQIYKQPEGDKPTENKVVPNGRLRRNEHDKHE